MIRMRDMLAVGKDSARMASNWLGVIGESLYKVSDRKNRLVCVGVDLSSKPFNGSPCIVYVKHIRAVKADLPIEGQEEVLLEPEQVMWCKPEIGAFSTSRCISS